LYTSSDIINIKTKRSRLARYEARIEDMSTIFWSENPERESPLARTKIIPKQILK
jgi:hypothetical protein